MLPPTLLSLAAVMASCAVPTHAARERSNQASKVARAPNVPSFFKPGVKWQIEISNPIKVSGSNAVAPVDARVWDVDMFDSIQGDASSNVIAKLRAAQRSSVGDIFVICYFNGGGLNPTDPDIKQFAETDILGTIPGWEDEHYVDVASSAVIELMKQRIDAGVAGGCDAFDPDNIDGYLQPSQVRRKTGDKRALTQADYYGYVRALADHTHAAGKLLGQKNAPELLALGDGTGRGVLRDGLVDFAVTEGCAVGGGDSSSDPAWCGSVQPFVDAGKPVLQIEYPSEWGNNCSPEALGTSALDKYCEYAAAGFSPIMKLDGDDCGLDGVTQYCGSTTIVNTPMES
ncbi:uncharacterized protein PG986_001498 [Apiospora aurea]|uniref:alpha-galactosidase n=1 Tax=Apiospora aurea TaxID=335848 RepID=A0ABR1QX18_9PEZI